MAVASSILFHFLFPSWPCLITLLLLFTRLSSADFHQPWSLHPEGYHPPTVFLFGDSTLDVGTNDYLPYCTAKANHAYHGYDFPPTNGEPAGRFSNGYNTADHIVFLMGHELSPLPYLKLVTMDELTFRKEIQHGVNFASGSSGLLDTTGFQSFKQVIPMGTQIDQFSTIAGRAFVNKDRAERPEPRVFSNAIFIISVGSNDVFDYKHFNYTINNTAVDFLGFGILMRTTYINHITRLYQLGARKFAIISMPPLGCTPYVRARNRGKCLEDANVFAQLFYADTMAWLEGLKLQLTEMQYSIGNAYAMTMNIISNPFTFFIEETEWACCGNGSFNGESECGPESSLCADRNKYLFWDWFHPTDFVSGYAARTLYKGDKQFVQPINFQQLVELIL